MAFNLNLDRCLCSDSSDCSDCRLWLLVGSDRQTDRQCQLLSCPGQLKRLMALALYSPPLRLDWNFYVANFLPLTVVWVNNSAWGVGKQFCLRGGFDVPYSRFFPLKKYSKNFWHKYLFSYLIHIYSNLGKMLFNSVQMCSIVFKLVQSLFKC